MFMECDVRIEHCRRNFPQIVATLAVNVVDLRRDSVEHSLATADQFLV